MLQHPRWCPQERRGCEPRVFTYGEPDDEVICIHRKSPSPQAGDSPAVIGDESQPMPITYGDSPTVIGWAQVT